MKKIKIPLRGDKGIWTCFILLTLISLIAVYSSIGRTAIESLDLTPTTAFLKHLLFVLITYVAIIFLSAANYRQFSKIAPAGYLVCIGLLLFIIFTHGQRWISIAGVSFQPSEIAKVVLVVYTARLLTIRKDSIDTLETFLRIMLGIVVIVALIVKENLSTAILIFITNFIMMIIGGVKKKYWVRTLAVIVVLGGGVLLYASNSSKDINFGRSETWQHRIESWLHPNHDELTQENMAKMAVARGKVMGVGIGSTVHARLMTQADNDFIYAIIIEESGMAGGLLILLIYSFFFYRCIAVANKCRGRFATLTVLGMGIMIYLQAFINMGVTVGVIPVTGQTLPFISYGGTAYVFMGCGIGIIQSIAYDNIKREKQEKINNSQEESLPDENTDTESVS